MIELLSSLKIIDLNFKKANISCGHRLSSPSVLRLAQIPTCDGEAVPTKTSASPCIQSLLVTNSAPCLSCTVSRARCAKWHKTSPPPSPWSDQGLHGLTLPAV